MKLVLVTLLIILSFSAYANNTDKENQIKIASFGGQMHVIAEGCGDYTSNELKNLKSEMQKASILSHSEFEKSFNSGYLSAKTKWNKMNQQQKDETCKNINGQ